MVPDASFIECRALEAEPGATVPLSRAEVDLLLADPAYRASLGQPAQALHYRKALPEGGGLHLVLHDGRGELHRDVHDPHGGLYELGRHLAAESPREWLGVLAAGCAVLRRLGRRAATPDLAKPTGGPRRTPEER